MKSSIIASCSIALVLAGAPLAAQTGPSSASPRPANGADAGVTNDYRLVVGDKLRIEVYKDPQLSQNLQVRPDGKITLPLIGDVVAAGQTPTALRDTVATALKEYVHNPVVTVIVVEAQPPTVSVMGEVNDPGVQVLKHRMTVIDALAMAGGFKDFAKTTKITIRRQTATGLQTINFNYKDAIKGESKPMYLEPGDVIIVP